MFTSFNDILSGLQPGQPTPGKTKRYNITVRDLTRYSNLATPRHIHLISPKWLEHM